MKLAILAQAAQKEEWSSKPSGTRTEIIWVNDAEELISTPADAYFDLVVENTNEQYKIPEDSGRLVFINSVIHPLANCQPPTANCLLVRLNAWPTFLKREIAEIAVADTSSIKPVEEIFSHLGWKHQLVPDITGLITARVVAMIINEAYYTLEAEVSSKEEIDLAMKLGTNYPYGPFEWSEKIGLKNIHALLLELSKTDRRYLPSKRMEKDL